MAALESAARIIQRIGCCHSKINGMAEKSRVHVDETQAKIDTLLSQIEQSFELLDELFLLWSAIYTMSSNKCNNGIRTRVMHGHMLKNPVTLNQIAAIKAMREAQGILRTQTYFMERGNIMTNEHPRVFDLAYELKAGCFEFRN